MVLANSADRLAVLLYLGTETTQRGLRQFVMAAILAPLFTRQAEKHTDANQHNFERYFEQRLAARPRRCRRRRMRFVVVLELWNVGFRHGAT